MGGTACPLYDPGNHCSIERGSDLQAARRGSLTTPAKPAGERESDAALTPRPGTRSQSGAPAGPNPAPAHQHITILAVSPQTFRAHETLRIILSEPWFEGNLSLN